MDILRPNDATPASRFLSRLKQSQSVRTGLDLSTPPQVDLVI